MSDHTRNQAWFDYFADRLRSTQLTHAAARVDQLERAEYVLKQIMQDLPAKHDWLNPDIEKLARVIVAK